MHAPARRAREPRRAFVARYALGRDYHKVLRTKLEALAKRIRAASGGGAARVFTDSAPVLEVALAARVGHRLARQAHAAADARARLVVLPRRDLHRPAACLSRRPHRRTAGPARACIDVCPTGAIVAPYELDARRCISYLTIELPGSIPEALRPLIGNRVYGCDDCQLVCPWNRYRAGATEAGFAVRHGLDDATLVELFAWTRSGVRRRAWRAARSAGSATSAGRATSPWAWQRTADAAIIAALAARGDDPSPLVREHVEWALARQQAQRRTLTARRARPGFGVWRNSACRAGARPVPYALPQRRAAISMGVLYAATREPRRGKVLFVGAHFTRNARIAAGS